MKTHMTVLRQCIGIACAISLLVLAKEASTQEAFFTGNFQNWALTVKVPNVGPIIGETDLEVRHPFWVSARPAGSPPRDPTDPANIAEAWTTDTYTNMRGLDGVVVPGATLHQEWIAVSPEEGAELSRNGLATIGSSGGFVFGLIRQVASPEATEAFGLQSIDTGEFIRGTDTVQGICG